MVVAKQLFRKYSRCFKDISTNRWYIYNPQEKVEYLSIGDDDEYDWQCDEISESELYDIISKKIAGKEQIGNIYFIVMVLKGFL